MRGDQGIVKTVRTSLILPEFGAFARLSGAWGDPEFGLRGHIIKTKPPVKTIRDLRCKAERKCAQGRILN